MSHASCSSAPSSKSSPEHKSHDHLTHQHLRLTSRNIMHVQAHQASSRISNHPNITRLTPSPNSHYKQKTPPPHTLSDLIDPDMHAYPHHPPFTRMPHLRIITIHHNAIQHPLPRHHHSTPWRSKVVALQGTRRRFQPSNQWTEPIVICLV